MEPTSAATRCVREWVRDALSSEAGTVETAPHAPAGELPALGDLIAAVLRQRVVELLHAEADRLALPTGLSDQLGRIRDAGRTLVPLQLLELARVRDLLEGAGVRYLVFKGPALAVQTTGDLGARGYGDLDVMVDPRQVEHVATLLLANGWGTAVPLPRQESWAWKRIVHTSHELGFVGLSCPVDLHWRLDPTLDALPSFDDLWRGREQVDLGGGPVPTLGRSDALAHACLNAAKDEWRWLRNLVDVHRLARLERVWETFDPSRLQLHALAVTEAQVGLPATTPEWVRDRVDRIRPHTTARLLASAVSAQDRPVRTLHEAPGSATVEFLRYQLAASASPRDVRRTLGSLVLPGRAVSEVDAASPWVGVPVGLGRRVDTLVRRSLGRAVGSADPSGPARENEPDPAGRAS